MNYLEWHVGMKVVYLGGAHLLLRRHGIRRLLGKWSRTPSRLNIGDVYELDVISIGRDRVTGLAEVGIGLKDDPDGEEGLHPARCFRPAQTRQTDISVFTALLTGTKQKALA